MAFKMWISVKDYDMLPLIYKNKIFELEDKIEDERIWIRKFIDGMDKEELAKFQKILITFSENYFMPKIYWDKWREVIEKALIDKFTKRCLIKNLKTRAKYHFYFMNGYSKLLNFKENCNDDSWSRGSNCDHRFVIMEEYEKVLKYPHSYVETYLKSADEFAACPLPKKLIEDGTKNSEIYNKIKSAEKNTQKWVECLLEANDAEFFKQNVELRLLLNPSDEKLWKLYIDYLEKVDIKEMLHVYSCYCRFFLDDSDALEKYKTASKKHGGSNVPWKNCYEFEKFDCKLLPKMKAPLFSTLTRRFINRVRNRLPYRFQKRRYHDSCEKWDNVLYFKNICKYERKEISFNNMEPIPIGTEFELNLMPIRYNMKNLRNQNFPFCSTIMNYILQNHSLLLRLKLNKTSKYFFQKLQTPVCHKLNLFGGPYSSQPMLSFYKNSASICQDGLPWPKDFKNICISNALCVVKHAPHNALTRALPYINRCEAKYIYLERGDLALEEFKFLVESGKVTNIYVCPIKDKNGDDVSLDQIMELLPNIEYFSAWRPIITSETTEKLCQIPFKNKIQYFKLIHFTVLDPYGFIDFLEKNFTPKSKVILMHQYSSAYFAQMFNKLYKPWKNKDLKPEIIFDTYNWW